MTLNANPQRAYESRATLLLPIKPASKMERKEHNWTPLTTLIPLLTRADPRNEHMLQKWTKLREDPSEALERTLRDDPRRIQARANWCAARVLPLWIKLRTESELLWTNAKKRIRSCRNETELPKTNTPTNERRNSL
jgi:hypothetical protein